MLDQTYQTQMNMAQQAVETWKDQGKDIAEFWAQNTPKMYQPEEIVQKATELYSFISNSLRTVSGGKDKDAA